MNKNEISRRITADMDAIIKMYQSGEDIKKIADKYNVTANTMCYRLYRSGIPIRHGDWHKEYYDKKPKYTRKFSPELIDKMKKNTAINRRYIKTYGK
jgi:Zn-dependent peptidase ImmA (M78 family)